MGIVDAHMHCWSLATPGHEWPTAATPALHRDFTPGDLRVVAGGSPLAGVVLVQSQPTDMDTDWMLSLAARDPLILGVVGRVDLAVRDANVTHDVTVVLAYMNNRPVDNVAVMSGKWPAAAQAVIDASGPGQDTQ